MLTPANLFCFFFSALRAGLDDDQIYENVTGESRPPLIPRARASDGDGASDSDTSAVPLLRARAYMNIPVGDVLTGLPKRYENVDVGGGSSESSTAVAFSVDGKTALYNEDSIYGNAVADSDTAARPVSYIADSDLGGSQDDEVYDTLEHDDLALVGAQASAAEIPTCSTTNAPSTSVHGLSGEVPELPGSGDKANASEAHNTDAARSVVGNDDYTTPALLPGAAAAASLKVDEASMKRYQGLWQEALPGRLELVGGGLLPGPQAVAALRKSNLSQSELSTVWNLSKKIAGPDIVHGPKGSLSADEFIAACVLVGHARAGGALDSKVLPLLQKMAAEDGGGSAASVTAALRRHNHGSEVLPRRGSTSDAAAIIGAGM